MFLRFSMAGLAAGLAFSILSAQAADTLPGGATSLTEVHDDWTVRCGAGANGVSCAATQEQLSQANRQRLVAVQLTRKDGLTHALFALPFGLKLAAGVTLAVDDGVTTAALPYQTCTADGCLVPTDFDGNWEAVLRAGASLVLTTTTLDDQPVKIAVSLKGLSAALDRIDALTQ